MPGDYCIWRVPQYSRMHSVHCCDAVEVLVCQRRAGAIAGTTLSRMVVGLSDLPVEVLAQVMNYLPLTDRALLEATCKTFQKACLECVESVRLGVLSKRDISGLSSWLNRLSRGSASTLRTFQITYGSVSCKYLFGELPTVPIFLLCTVSAKYCLDEGKCLCKSIYLVPRGSELNLQLKSNQRRAAWLSAYQTGATQLSYMCGLTKTLNTEVL